jgi:hypothetical protein
VGGVSRTQQPRRDREIALQGENHKQGSSYRNVTTKWSDYRNGATTKTSQNRGYKSPTNMTLLAGFQLGDNDIYIVKNVMLGLLEP